MAALLRKVRGIWIGWPGQVASSEGTVRQALTNFSELSEFELYPVMLDQDSIDNFYNGFANQVIWPLFHDLQSRCNFEPQFWETFLRVQQTFCDTVLKHVQTQDLIWVHDYHLIGLGAALKKAGVNNKMCFYLHIPFPPPDIFLKLPWRVDVIEALLSHHLIGFQTSRDLANFLQCAALITNLQPSPRGAHYSIKFKGHECVAGNFPISIDFSEFDGLAKLPEVEAAAQTIRTDMNCPFLVLSVDRLDYTKGIPHRIRAFKRLLELCPELKKRIAFLQVVVPSRVEVPEYQSLRSEIEQIVSQVNGALAEPGWVPVHHLFRSLSREEVIAMYRAADLALVTPLKDGMNLVAKEYCASRIKNDGVLVLSEFAGAAYELGEYAILVNPYDLEGVAKALKYALSMPAAESTRRMQALRGILEKSDVINWARTYLLAAGWEWRSLEASPQPARTIWSRLARITQVFDI